MSSLLPHVALALVGSGFLTGVQSVMADHCTNFQWKDAVHVGVIVTSALWWVATLGALGFALAPGTWFAAFAAHMSLFASALAAFNAVVMVAIESAVCNFFDSEKLARGLVYGYNLSGAAAFFALTWRAVSGG